MKRNKTVSWGWCWGMAALVLFWAAAPAVAGDRAKSMIDCNIQEGPCDQMIAGRRITLEISPKPVTAMQDLIFRVSLDSPIKTQDGAYIELNMPAMNMGRNRVMLKHVGEGVYEGRGVIVRCKSGDRTWRAVVNFPELGSANFTFDVVY